MALQYRRATCESEASFSGLDMEHLQPVVDIVLTISSPKSLGEAHVQYCQDRSALCELRERKGFGGGDDQLDADGQPAGAAVQGRPDGGHREGRHHDHRSRPDRSVQMAPGAKLADVVKALNSLGATPQDLLAILQAMKSAGALTAELEVI